MKQVDHCSTCGCARHRSHRQARLSKTTGRVQNIVKEENGLQHCFCLYPVLLFVRKYGKISFVGKCLYPIEQKATTIIMFCNLAIKSY